MAVQAHLLAKDYGVLPTEALNQPAEDFHLNGAIRAAGVQWEREAQEAAQRDEGTGVATSGEREDLVASNDERADARDEDTTLGDQMGGLDDMDRFGGGAPDTEGGPL